MSPKSAGHNATRSSAAPTLRKSPSPKASSSPMRKPPTVTASPRLNETPTESKSTGRSTAASICSTIHALLSLSHESRLLIATATTTAKMTATTAIAPTHFRISPPPSRPREFAAADCPFIDPNEGSTRPFGFQVSIRALARSPMAPGSGCVRALSMVDCKLWRSSISHKNPLSLSSIHCSKLAPRGPSTSLPRAIASRQAFGKLSLRDGNTITLA